MFKITMDNLQAIGHAEIQSNERGILEFTGANSNGKSILTKTLEIITNGDIKDKETRRLLIKRGFNEGCLVIQIGVQQLGFVIGVEQRDTFLVYVPNVLSEDKSNNIVRFLGEKGWDEILHQFGLRVYDKGNICLQLAPTFGAMPFVSTSSSTNWEIQEDISRDKVAEEFVTSFEKITYPAFRAAKTRLESRIEDVKSVLNSMADYDYEAYGTLAEKMKNLYNATKNYKFYTLKNIPIPPEVNVVPLKPFVLKNIPVITMGPILKSLGNISDDIGELEIVQNGTCPTCGKRLLDHSVAH